MVTEDRHDEAKRVYQQSRRTHWDGVAKATDRWHGIGGYYHRRLADVYQFLVPPGQSIIELGCGQGDLLAACGPPLASAWIFRPRRFMRARTRHPIARIHRVGRPRSGRRSQVRRGDPVGSCQRPVGRADRVREGGAAEPPAHADHPELATASSVGGPLGAAKTIGLARPMPMPQNWLTVHDVTNLLPGGFRSDQAVARSHLARAHASAIDAFCNRFLARLWPIKHLSLSNFIVARPATRGRDGAKASVSVVVAARNEAGNVPEIFSRLPKMGEWTELIFVEGHSKDDTFEAIETAIAEHPEQPCAAAEAERHRQGRRRPRRVSTGHGRHPDDSGRRPDRAARGPAALL